MEESEHKKDIDEIRALVTRVNEGFEELIEVFSDLVEKLRECHLL